MGFNQQIVEAVLDHYGSRKNAIKALSDFLPIGTDAIYRRLSGHVHFTLDDFLLICEHTGISSEIILGKRSSKHALFDLHLLNSDTSYKALEQYKQSLERSCDVVRMFREKDHVTVRHSTNTVPLFFYCSYKELSKFKLYRWMHQTRAINPLFKYNQFFINDDVISVQQKVSAESSLLNETVYILDRRIFVRLMQEIFYFRELNLLASSEIEVLRQEVLQMLDSLEQLCIRGRYNSGGIVRIYLCEIDLENSYIHIECSDYQYLQFRVYSINLIDSYNKAICDKQKHWIDTLKQFTVEITDSNEKERNNFFTKQRSYVDKWL